MPKKALVLSIDNEHGFTLMEVLMAVAIFSIGFLAVAAMQLSVIKNNTTGNVRTQALALAQAKMEEIKNSDIKDALLSPAGLTNDNTIDTEDSGLLDENGNTGTGGIYTRSWTVSKYVENKGASNSRVIDDAREVTVTVAFTLAMGGKKEVSITSVVTGGGI